MPESTQITSSGTSSILDRLLPRPLILPGEDPAIYEGLRDAFLRDLAPRSPYERALAENLVQLEWEASRYRRMRDDLIRSKARDLAIGAFATGEVEEVDNYAARDATLAFELVGSDPERAAAAALILQEFDITPSEILAQAYSRVSAQVEMHEKKLAAIEMRRRRLREEYDRLRAARPKPVEDAEILE